MDDYFTPDTLLDDTLDELAQAREMVRFLTRANEALTAQLESTLKDRAQIIADRDRLRDEVHGLSDKLVPIWMKAEMVRRSPTEHERDEPPQRVNLGLKTEDGYNG